MSCGDGRLGSDKCDEDALDCVDCVVAPLRITESGRYAGRFQAGSFDRFEIIVSGDFDVRLETAGESDACPGDTLITVTSDVLEEAVGNDNIGVDSVCSRVDIDAVEAVYAVEVRGGSTAPADGVIEYVLIVEYNDLCTPGENECPDPCAEDNGGCHPQASCSVEGRSVECVCGPGFDGDGQSCTDIDECTQQTDDCAEEARCENTEGLYTCTCMPGYDGDGRVCSDIPCPEGQRVASNQCVACQPGTQNAPGDLASGPDTACDDILCDPNQYVSDNRCAPCPPGTVNTPGDNASGVDTVCDAVLCVENQRVSNHVCRGCEPGTSNAAGDNAAGDDTLCDAVLCGANERVINFSCTPCPPGKTNAPGDAAPGGNTSCDAVRCDVNQRVEGNRCIDCNPVKPTQQAMMQAQVTPGATQPFATRITASSTMRASPVNSAKPIGPMMMHLVSFECDTVTCRRDEKVVSMCAWPVTPARPMKRATMRRVQTLHAM